MLDAKQRVGCSNQPRRTRILMKLWIKIFFSAIIVFALLFSAVYFYLVFKGRSMIIEQLQALTGKKVHLGSFDLTLPLDLEIKKLQIEELANIDDVFVSTSILGLLTGRIVFNKVEIIKPEFSYVRAPAQEAELAQQSSGHIAKFKKPPLRFLFKRIIIKDGKIDLMDRTVSAEGLKITVKEINFDLSNLYVFPRSVITNFELKGKIPWQEGQEEGKIEVEGWLNLVKKDMQASLKITDIDGIYLYPYYSNWVDLEKARIEKAKLNFTSNITGLNNNVTAECHLELSDIVRKSRPSEEPEEKAERITNAVLDIFRALNQGKIVLDFTIRTKMDRPEFGFSSIKMAFEDKIAKGRKTNGFKVQDVLSLPGNIIQGTAKGATDISKAVLDGALSIGKELKKTVEGAFKREKEE